MASFFLLLHSSVLHLLLLLSSLSLGVDTHPILMAPGGAGTPLAPPSPPPAPMGAPLQYPTGDFPAGAQLGAQTIKWGSMSELEAKPATWDSGAKKFELGTHYTDTPDTPMAKNFMLTGARSRETRPRLLSTSLR